MKVKIDNIRETDFVGRLDLVVGKTTYRVSETISGHGLILKKSEKDEGIEITNMTKHRMIIT